MADSDTTLALREIVRDPKLLAEKRRELDALRTEHSKEWAQNREFYKGNQWVFWNRSGSRIETIPVDEGDKPRYKVRLTKNRITPGVQQLIAMMTKTRPVIRAMPDSGADKDVKSAQMAERLYEYWWMEFGLGSKLQSALVNAQVSQGYWLITWDPLAGKPFRVLLNPQTGQPITDDRLADLFKDELAQQAQQIGMQPEQLLAQYERVLHLGDIRVQVLDGPSVWLDPVPGNFEDATYAICRYPMSVDDIEARWGKRVTPDASTMDARPPLMAVKGDDNKQPKNARHVYVGYFKPTPSLPKGRYVVWTENPHEFLYEGDWEFPTNDIPLVKFPGIERPGSIYDDTRVALVRPLQKELNNKVSKAAMHMNLTLKPQMIAPAGSLRQRLTDEPGAVFEYNPIAGLQPEWRPIPNLPAHVFTYIETIEREIDRVFNLMPTERSQLPPRTDSGNLVDLIQEAVADQLSPEIRRMEEGLARAGTLMAALAQRFYIEPRLLKIRGEGGSVQVSKFLKSDIEGGFTFHAEAGSGLPRTRAGQTQQIKEMIEMGILSPQEALPYLPIAGLKALSARVQADEEQALREIDKLLRGEPINPMAAQAAISQVQSGINPQTGHPFMSPEEAIAFVEEAALQPLPFENMATHLAVLSQHMKGIEFESYAPDVQQRFLTHFQLTQQALMSIPQVDGDLKVTLGLNGTVGPTVAAEILQKKGITQATPETMAEPPLETSVYDSMDKPDADDAGNDPLTQMEQLHSMQQAEEQHGLKVAKATADTALAEQRAAHADAQNQQTLQHAEERHQAQLRQQASAHAERIRQARQKARTSSSGG